MLPDRREILNLRDKLKGKLIVFDGPDGSGKSTALARTADRLDEGITDKYKVVRVREPGGTKYGEHIREVLLHTVAGGEELDKTAEMLLFLAARMQLMNRVVVPALKARKIVFADRFVSSTLAYQGEGLGIDYDQILNIHKLAIPDEHWPACTLILDVCDRVARQRLSLADGDENGTAELDKIESRSDEFRKRVRFGYLRQAVLYPEHACLVDANGPVDEVVDACLSALKKHLV